jgi:RNA polymerase sigma-70 factor (ECF subfamily)
MIKTGKAKRREAFERVVNEYESALLRYGTRLLRNPDAAQDVVQEAFIRLFRKWKDELAPSPQVSSWLYRVVHNCAVDYLRKVTRRQALHQRHAKEQPHMVAPDRGTGFRISEAAARAAAALDILKERERQLVILKVYEEKSYREIADISDLTVSNVGYILHHAMKKLAQELKKVKTT